MRASPRLKSLSAKLAGCKQRRDSYSSRDVIRRRILEEADWIGGGRARGDGMDFSCITQRGRWVFEIL